MQLPNVLLVTVDCMRRDRLSAYGYERRTTPFLDSILDRAIHCSSAHSVSSWTCPAVASMLTGLYPHRHGGGLVPGEPKNLGKRNLPTKLDSSIPALPDILGARGYTTAAIGGVWNAHLAIPGRFPTMQMLERPAPKLVQRALGWIRAQEGPFFLWLHLGDAHEPLDVPNDMRNVFGSIPRLRRVRRWDYTTSKAAVETDAFVRYRDARIRMYDVAVRSADAAIGALWEGLAGLGVRDRTLFAVSSDHGEELWEHREQEMASFVDPRDIYGVGHGHNLFQVHLLIPLVLLGPGIEPREVRDNVSLLDLFPSLLDAAGLDPGTVQGRSLLSSPSSKQRSILAEAIAYGFDKRAVIAGDEKLLSAPGDGYESAFLLGADRREAGAIGDPAAIDRLRRYLPGGEIAMGEQVEQTDEIEEHLRALGYIE